MSKRTQPRTLPERVADIEERLRSVTTAVITGVVGGDHGLLSGLEEDDHPQYQLRSEEGAAGGYASLDGDATVPKAQLPADVVYEGATGDVGELEKLLWLTMTEGM